MFNKTTFLIATNNIYLISPKLYFKSVFLASLSGILEIIYLFLIASLISGEFVKYINSNILPQHILIVAVSLVAFIPIVKLVILNIINSICANISYSAVTLYAKDLLDLDYSEYQQLEKNKIQFELTKSQEQIYLSYVCPYFNVLTNSIIAFGLITLLLLSIGSNILLALICVGCLFLALQKFSHKKLRKHIARRYTSEINISSAVNEIINGFKDIKINNLSIISHSNYKLILNEFKSSLTSIQFQGLWPKNVIESLLFLAIIISSSFLSETSNASGLVAGVISILKFVPTANGIYINYHSIVSHIKAVEPIFARAEKVIKTKKLRSYHELNNNVNCISSLEVKIENFIFPNKTHVHSLQNLVALFEVGQINFIAGKSGSGKTTLLDIISGIYNSKNIKITSRPSNSKQYVAHLDNHLYRQDISYAPQRYYPFQRSLIFNITLKYHSLDEMNEYELRMFNEACYISQIPIHLIENNHIVSDSELSGGQLQRIGLARAIFRNKPILLLDEITSALDSTTSHAIMTNLYRISSSRLIICVTHDQTLITKFGNQSTLILS